MLSLGLFGSHDKNLFAVATMKNSYNNQLYSSVAAKEEKTGAKRSGVACRCQYSTTPV